MKKCLLLLLTFTQFCFSQNGSNDNTFNIGGSGFSGGDVRGVAVQSDNKIYVCGTFTQYNSLATTKLVRLTGDGNLDATFNAVDISASEYVNNITLQPDGKILISGEFTKFSAYGTLKLRRYNTDGTVDSYFPTFGMISQSSISSIQIVSNKILVSGDFYNSAPSNKKYIILLNMDGSVDNAFTFDYTYLIGTSIDNVIKVLPQLDGKYVVVSKNKVFRINSNGSIDSTFQLLDFTYSPSSYLYTLTSGIIQSDGKILIGGTFSSVNGISKNNLVRLNTDGNIDNTFVTSTNSRISEIIKFTNDELLIAGQFTTINNISANGLAKLSINGNLDASFNSGNGPNGNIKAMALQNNKIIIVGSFSLYNNISRGSIARINNQTALSTYESIKENFTILPNPTKNYITFQNKEKYSENFEYKILDLAGRIIKKGNSKFNEQLNIESLTNGNYIIQIETEKGEKLTKKLIKN